MLADAASRPGAGEAEMAALARASIDKGSQSFAAAARLFEPSVRLGATLLYQWCRYCDDVVDNQDHGHHRREIDLARPAGGPPASTLRARIAELEAETRRAFAGEPVESPSFRALQLVAERHRLPLDLALTHLEGFRMDVDGRQYRRIEDTLDYCHHVAGVVGVMMGHVMGVHDAPTLQRAADLGLAFQLTNIARDIVPDAHVGRVYLPSDWLDEEGIAKNALADPRNRPGIARLAARLVALAEPYYASARLGLNALPRRSAWAVATAHGVYRQIGLDVVARGAGAWDERVSTSKAHKLCHVAKGAVIAFGPRDGVEPGRPSSLWSHEV